LRFLRLILIARRPFTKLFSAGTSGGAVMGSLAFDDAVGEVSGTWILGRPPSSQPGLLLYIMVDSVAATLDAVVVHGGEVVQPIGVDAPDVTARFRDPAGNVIGLYQEPTKSAPGKSSFAS
jgi:predicted enzyme related to lactoylglutathione lyase